MKKDDFINGYKILQDFTTAGGGLSKWTFAKKKDGEFFIKEFLRPTYPVKDSPGSPKTKEEKKKQCIFFEDRHKKLKDVLARRCSAGGNLIVTKDFFRFGAKYYKVTDKVDVASLQVSDVSALPLEKRELILLTIAHSLRILHQENIVHGDLKPANILIKKTTTDYYTTKLIDFDDSYFSGVPPTTVEEIVGDMVYYSPELGRYIQGDKYVKPNDLQLMSDIFALGLIYCQYLTGKLPPFDQEKYQYPWVAANNGTNLTFDDKSCLPSYLALLINDMLQVNPTDRPTIEIVFDRLKSKDRKPPEKKSLEVGGGLKGTLLGKSDDSETTPSKEVKKTDEIESKLRGKLLKPKKS